MATMTSFDAMLKRKYDQQFVQNNTYKKRPGLGLLPKYEGYGGQNLPVPVTWANPQGVGAVFATAQANVSNASVEAFLITVVENHSIAHVSSKVIKMSRNDKMAFARSLKHALDSARNSLADDLETAVYRDGTGYIGQISSGSTVTNQTVTLADIRDVRNFEVGMRLVAASGKTAALRTSGASEVLAGVNRSTGVLTATSAQWDTVITAIAASDWLFRESNAHNNSSHVMMRGFEAWLPATAPSGGESFFGVDRSTDSRKWGTYYDGSSDSQEDALIRGVSDISAEGGEPKLVFVNHAQHRVVAQNLQARSSFVQSDVSARMGKGVKAMISFSGLKLATDAGDIDLIPANKCPSTIAFPIDVDHCRLVSAGPLIDFDDSDGQRILRRSNAAGVEARLVSYPQIAFSCPNYSGHIAMPSV